MPTLTQQQQTLIVELGYACGLSDTELSHVSALPGAAIIALMQSPLFHAEVAALRKRLSATQLNEAQAMLEGEAIASIECLTAVRDNIAINPSIRVRAADSILDRIESTSKQHKVSHALTIPVEFTDKQIAQLLAYMSHDTQARDAFDAATRLLSAQQESEAIDCESQEINSITQSSELFSTPGSAHSEDSHSNPIASDDSLSDEILSSSIHMTNDLRQFLSSSED